MRNKEEDVTYPATCCQHPMHEGISAGRHRDFKTKKFVLRILRHCCRGTQAKEINVPSLREVIDRALNRAQRQLISGQHQRGNRVVKELAGIGIDIVIHLDRTADVTNTRHERPRET